MHHEGGDASGAPAPRDDASAPRGAYSVLAAGGTAAVQWQQLREQPNVFPSENGM